MRVWWRSFALAALTFAIGCGEEVVPPVAPGEALLEVVADGLEEPVLVTHAPGQPDRLYIIEKPGRIRIVDDGALLSTPFLDIESSTADRGEQGLLGLAFDPGYATNGHFFVFHTDLGGDTRVLRFRADDPDEADPTSQAIVLDVEQPFSNHNGGHIAFGPDGYLYVALGDGGSGGDPLGHGQNVSTLLGAILRIDVSTLPYTIPSDNPFAASLSAAPEIWAWGLRNPWRFSFDRETGGLWIGDVGQGEIEEISYAPPTSAGGENFGWARLEGSRCFPADPCDASGTVLPTLEYGHAQGCSVTGGYVYRGRAIPNFQGRYFFADFCDGWIRSFHVSDMDDPTAFDHTVDFGTVPSIASFGEDAAGELYVVSTSGTVYRVIDPN